MVAVAKHSRHLCVFLTILLGLFTPVFCLAGEQTVGVLLSREIAPYVAMVEGFEARVGNLPVQRFFLDDQGNPFTLAGRGALLDPTKYSALVAVGPEALRYLAPRVGSVPLIYGMVLSPDSVVPAGSRGACGVSLNIPVREQLASIRQHLPATVRLGVLFDPANNQKWFNDAVTTGASMGMQLVPLQVSREDGKFDIVGDIAKVDTILFLPDKTIISRAVIQHVIKTAALHRIPVVGYNQFFYDSGAALNFIIDYRTVGEQVAAQVLQALAGDNCQDSVAPTFATRINPDAWRALGLKLPMAADR